MTSEQAIRSMTRPERVAYLTARGWTCVDSQGLQTWHDPGETGSYTLAAAVLCALGGGSGEVDRHAVESDVRRSIDLLVQLGSLEALPPGDLARIGAAARTFNRTIASIVRRRGAGAARSGGQSNTHNPNGDPA